MAIQYTKEILEEVERLFPENQEILQAARQGKLELRVLVEKQTKGLSVKARKSRALYNKLIKFLKGNQVYMRRKIM